MRPARIGPSLLHRALVVAGAVVCLAIPARAAAGVPVEPYGTNDARRFRHVLPAGAHGPRWGRQRPGLEAAEPYAPPFAGEPHPHRHPRDASPPRSPAQT